MSTPVTAAAPAAQAATTNQPQNNQASTTGVPAPTPAEVRKMKLKLDGQDVELPESEVISLAQQGKVSGKRFQEAAALKKQAEDVLKFAKENPTEFFKKTGMNARQWAEEYLIGELQREQMTPEQRKAAENEAKLKEYEDERKAADEAKAEAGREQLRQQHAERYDKLFVEALGKSGLPKTPFTVKRMAELQLVNIQKKLELSADQLAKVVREDYMNEQKALFGAFEGDQLLEFLGPELTKKLSKAQISKLKGKGVSAKVSNPPPPREDGKELTWKEWQRQNRRRSA